MDGSRAGTLAPAAPPGFPHSCTCRAPRGLAQGLRQPAHVLHQVREGPARRAGACHDDDHHVASHLPADLPVRFADPATGPITGDRAADLATHRETHPPALPAPPQRHEARALVPATVLEDRLEFRRSPEALASWQRPRRLRREHRAVLDRQALSSLCAAPLEDLPPALCLHARAKSVRLLPASHIGLKRPLHGKTPLSMDEPAQSTERSRPSQGAQAPCDGARRYGTVASRVEQHARPTRGRAASRRGAGTRSARSSQVESMRRCYLVRRRRDPENQAPRNTPGYPHLWISLCVTPSWTADQGPDNA